MSDQIKYIVSYHVDTTWPESDHYYIAKQGSNGPIDLTEDEVKAVVRRLNGGLMQYDSTCTGRPSISHECCPTLLTIRDPRRGGLITRTPLNTFIGEGI